MAKKKDGIKYRVTGLEVGEAGVTLTHDTQDGYVYLYDANGGGINFCMCDAKKVADAIYALADA